MNNDRQPSRPSAGKRGILALSLLLRIIPGLGARESLARPPVADGVASALVLLAAALVPACILVAVYPPLLLVLGILVCTWTMFACCLCAGTGLNAYTWELGQAVRAQGGEGEPGTDVTRLLCDLISMSGQGLSEVVGAARARAVIRALHRLAVGSTAVSGDARVVMAAAHDVNAWKPRVPAPMSRLARFWLRCAMAARLSRFSRVDACLGWDGSDRALVPGWLRISILLWISLPALMGAAGHSWSKAAWCLPALVLAGVLCSLESRAVLRLQVLNLGCLPPDDHDGKEDRELVLRLVRWSKRGLFHALGPELGRKAIQAAYDMEESGEANETRLASLAGLSMLAERRTYPWGWPRNVRGDAVQIR